MDDFKERFQNLTERDEIMLEFQEFYISVNGLVSRLLLTTEQMEEIRVRAANILDLYENFHRTLSSVFFLASGLQSIQAEINRHVANRDRRANYQKTRYKKRVSATNKELQEADELSSRILLEQENFRTFLSSCLEDNLKDFPPETGAQPPLQPPGDMDS